jgi:diguanylate cyclase (GGDEF)-like protein
MSKLIDYLDSQNALFHVFLNAGIVAVIVLIDSSSGHELSFAIFYLIPVSLAAWFLSEKARSMTLIFCAIAWIAAELFASRSHADSASAFWNAAERFIVLLLIASLLIRLRSAFLHQKTLARTDYLTGVANSRHFFETAQNEINRVRRYKRPLTLAYLDVDDFKSVNDEYGHGVGDRVLKTVCTGVKRNLRETDMFARLGGDEFAILLPETDRSAAEVVIQKMREGLLAEMCDNGWCVTFSIGVVTCVDPPPSVAEVVKWGDDLAYQAKRSGKNTVKYDVATERLAV